MPRKLFALLVLIGTIGFLALGYVYFFVYYTSVVVFDANIQGYKVEFYSSSTAQKWSYDCPEKFCELPDISPFEYKISLSKSGYEPQVIQTKIFPRKKQEFIINFEKKAQISEILEQEIFESIQEKIKRISLESEYYEIFDLGNSEKILFLESGDTLEMLHEKNNEQEAIRTFPRVSRENIDIQRIYGSEDIFLRMGEKKFFFSLDAKRILEISFTGDIQYIKKSRRDYEYFLVTKKGTFVYNTRENASDYSYLFRDYVELGDDIIGIVFNDETQKKKNFNFEKSGNLIIKYSLDSKERKIIYSTQQNIEKIFWREDKIILAINGKEFMLENYD